MRNVHVVAAPPSVSFSVLRLVAVLGGGGGGGEGEIGDWLTRTFRANYFPCSPTGALHGIPRN